MTARWLTFVYGLVVVSSATATRVPRASASSSSGASSSATSSSNSGGGGGYGGGVYSGGGGFYFPYAQPFSPFPYDFTAALMQQQQAAFMQHQAAIAALQAQSFNQGFAFPGYVNSNSLSSDGAVPVGGFGTAGGNYGGYGGGNGGPDGGAASGSVNYGPSGGYGVASAGDSDGINLRIGGGEFPAPSGDPNTFGTFSSSSSSSSDVNGKKSSFHQSTVGVQENGKIHFKTVSSP